MEFIQEYPLDELAPASYNPRTISDDSFEALRASISLFGVVKPIILNGSNKVLTAGHQRTRAMKSLGLTSAPAIILPEISLQDEIKFNLFHNSIETNRAKVKIEEIDRVPYGYSFINSNDINIQQNSSQGAVLKEIAGLIARYGEWGSVVVSDTGDVIENSDYAVALKAFKKPLLIYKMDRVKIEEYKRLIDRDFGEYSYEPLGIKPYNQLYCQLPRLSEGISSKTGKEKKQNKSRLYENHIMKDIKNTDRLIDFGAGKCSYVNLLKSNGYNAFAYEPHYQSSKKAIDIKTVVSMIRDIYYDIKHYNLYDIVVLDSVLNSITDNRYENYVMTSCNALCSKTGTFYTICRDLEDYNYNMQLENLGSSSRVLQFLDKDNFTATFRQGVWTLQKFNTVSSLTGLCKKYFTEVEVYADKGNVVAICRKPIQLSREQYREALSVEFNMEYPGGYRHNKHTKLVELIEKMIEER